MKYGLLNFLFNSIPKIPIKWFFFLKIIFASFLCYDIFGKRHIFLLVMKIVVKQVIMIWKSVYLLRHLEII